VEGSFVSRVSAEFTSCPLFISSETTTQGFVSLIHPSGIAFLNSTNRDADGDVSSSHKSSCPHVVNLLPDADYTAYRMPTRILSVMLPVGFGPVRLSAALSGAIIPRRTPYTSTTLYDILTVSSHFSLNFTQKKYIIQVCM
jgi:hypothetical protein